MNILNVVAVVIGDGGVAIDAVVVDSNNDDVVAFCATYHVLSLLRMRIIVDCSIL